MARPPSLPRYVSERLLEVGDIPTLRRASLTLVGRRILEALDRTDSASVMFVCTHNARRSQLAQVWATVAAQHFRLGNVRAYSGGSAPTTVHPRILASLADAGLVVRASVVNGRETHEVRYAPAAEGIRLRSKRFDDVDQPRAGFIAVVNCPSADEGCPTIPGAAHRLALLYADPGAMDGTVDEERVYPERCAEIARDMLFLFACLRDAVDATRAAS